MEGGPKTFLVHAWWEGGDHLCSPASATSCSLSDPMGLTAKHGPRLEMSKERTLHTGADLTLFVPRPNVYGRGLIFP